MLPVVLRFSHPAWGFVLPAVLGVLAAFLAFSTWRSWRSYSRGGKSVAALSVVFAAAAALYSTRHPVVPAPVIVHGFGVWLCVAVLAAWGTAGYAVKAQNLDRSRLAGMFVACGVGALLGARVLFVLTAPPGGWREALAAHQGGLSLWGALLGGTLVLWGHCRLTTQEGWAWGATLAPAALVAVALGRMGCFASGSHFGQEMPTTAWPVLRGLGTYPRWPDEVMRLAAGPPVWVEQAEKQQIAASRLLSNPTHPVQLYEVLAVGALLVVALRQRNPWRRPRELCCVLGLGYAAIAFALEWLRGDLERGLLGPQLRVGVWMLLGAGVLGVVLMFTLRGFERPSLELVRWGAAFVVAYGSLLGLIASQLGQVGIKTAQLSVAQVLALLAAVWVAFVATRLLSRTPVQATVSPAAPP